MRFLLIMVFVVLAACGGGDGSDGDSTQNKQGSTTDDGARSTTPIVFETVAKGAQGPTTAATVVARSQAEFDAAWAANGGSGNPSLGSIDYDTQMVIAVFLGQQPNAGYDVEVTSINSIYEVSYDEVSPGAECITAQVLTAPFHVVVVPTSDTDATFLPEQRVNPC
ncbi:MAG: protease complex subunit PrcB family protein [Acidimicrobiales bacterium]